LFWINGKQAIFMALVSYNEYKFLVTNENLSYIKQILEALYGHSDPYPSGIVDTIYYDDTFGSTMRSSLEGDAVRRKVRIRGYGDGRYPCFQLKTKEMYAVGKIKQPLASIPFDIDQLPTLIDLARQNPERREFQAIVGSLLREGEMYPVIRVKYYRYRYRINDYRVTLDTDIEITGLGPSGSLELLLPTHVLEVKRFENKPHLPFLGLIKLPQISFSKFTLGLSMLQQGALFTSLQRN
jgi:hypothetical protein